MFSSLGAGVLLAATVIVGLYLGGQTQHQFSQIDQGWRDYSEKADRRGELLGRINGHLGYGGIIHNFKNYVLRKSPDYRAALTEQFADFTATVGEYRASGATPFELVQLSEIERTIGVYASKMPIADEAARQGWPPARTDPLVKVDDTGAVDALAALDTFWREQRADATRAISAAVAEGNAFVATGYRFLFALAAVALAIFALFFLLQRELLHTIRLLSHELQERRAAEHEAKKFQRAVEQSPATIIITNTKGLIEFVNAKFCDLTGYTRNEVHGRTPRFLQSGDETPETYLSLRQQLARGEEWTGTFRNLKKNGEAYWAKTTILPLRDEDGDITHFIGLGEDTTEHRKAREQMHRAQKMEAVGLLASGVAHDFNNMLTTILGNVHIAREDAPKTGEFAEELSHIEIAAKRARNLVGQVLAFARRQPGQAQSVPIGEALAEACGLVRASTQPSIEIITSSSEPTLSVLADPTQLHQVIMNLCANAAEAIGPLGGRITATAERIAPTPDQDARVRITVRDDGPGIPADVREHIFDPFFTTKATGKGTGLGLSVVSNLVAEMNGTISVESTPGEGTSFDVLLPEVAYVRLDPEPVRQRRHGSGVVMLIDDDAGVVATTCKLIRRLGYEADTYTDPEAGVAAFEADPDRYRLVITDFIMPQMNGEEVSWIIRNRRAACPIIIYSAYQPATLVVDELAPIRILSKPADPDLLADTISHMIHLS